MLRKSSVRPGRPVSIGSLIGLVFMLLFGIGFAIIVGNVLHENEAPVVMSLVFFLFMVAWFATALYMLIYHIVNLRRPQGLPLFEIETSGESGEELSPARKLRDLEQLKKDGLINQEEYSRKRAEILAEKW